LTAGTSLDDQDRALLLAQRRTLEMIADGAALVDILEELCRKIGAQQPDVISTILLMEPDGQRPWPGAGPCVSAGWTRVIAPLAISPELRSSAATSALTAL
jgi:hypothetical protein